tara:strand:- start:2579 stop:2947 length:369 start_codon:yes stop_codon:yes gene_type:complete
MLINQFFYIINIEQTEDNIRLTIQLNASHQIFEGHFPNNPIAPGVVQIQIVKELLENVLNEKFMLKEMGRCKFLAILNPHNNPEIKVNIYYSLLEDNTLKITAEGLSIDDSQTFFKFTAKYV